MVYAGLDFFTYKTALSFFKRFSKFFDSNSSRNCTTCSLFNGLLIFKESINGSIFIISSSLDNLNENCGFSVYATLIFLILSIGVENTSVEYQASGVAGNPCLRSVALIPGNLTI